MTLDISNLSKHRSKIYLGTSVSVKFDVGAGALVPDSALDEACERFSTINFDLCSSVEDLASRIAFCVNQDQITPIEFPLIGYTASTEPSQG